MKMLAVCWEDVTEETMKKCFAKSHISPQDQTSAQDDLDDPFIELRSDLEKLKFLGVDDYPEEVSPEELQVLMIPLPQQSLCYLSILAMVREVEE